LYDSSLSPLAVRVYGVLARHGMDPESCYPSHAAIAQRVGCAQRSVQRPLRELEDAGWITRVARYDERGDRRSDGFIVRVEPAQDNAPPAQESVDPPAQDNAHPPRSGARSKESHENESNEERVLALVASSSADRFDEFWEAYPSSRDKAAAQKAWTKALKKASADDIIAGALRYRDDPGRDPRYTKYAQGWLTDERWNDEVSPAEQPRPRAFAAIEASLAGRNP
jgi:DNA-binding transcriptional MocR family regulator